jgi:hypothetical protein
MIQGHKSAPHGVRLPFLITLVACLALMAPTRVHASAAQRMDQALAASKTWVAEIDTGKYEDSYSFACEQTRNQYPEDQWVAVLKTLRGPWGGVVDRHQLSHVYEPNGIKGSKPIDGECMVITYSTNFANFSNVIETVILKWEDGQWRGAGYFAGVPPDPNAPPSESDATTEVQTHEHVKPQPDSQ